MIADRSYRTKQWFAFRQETLRLAGLRCEKCERAQSDGAVLQVHHRHYIDGKAAWDYDFSDCEVLCKGCHARRHGRIMPIDGWSYEGDSDLGDLVGECERCGTALRYEFSISHPLWYDMVVGTICCDELTGTKEASDRRRLIERRKEFCSPSRWIEGDGSVISSFKGVDLKILSIDRKFRIEASGVAGKIEFDNSLEAKIHLHGLFENGDLKRFLDKWKGRVK